MSKTILLVAISALLIAGGCNAIRNRQLNAEWRGKIAPDFELSQLGGETVKLSDLRGRPVVLSFFGST